MIEVKNLVKRYGNHTAVDHLTFTVETGKVVGFLGPNGAGKTTTMNMITGYIAQSEGTILIDGIDITKEPEKAKKKIGYLPEIPPLYQDLRVREYLEFVAELKKVRKKDKAMMVYQIMKKTGTDNVSERLISHLSKGYKQRVGFGAAMIGDPDILIMDEPTVGLDPRQIVEIRDLIRELSKDHTVLLSSHIMQEISAVCDEVIIINEGQMIACDTPENITKQVAKETGIHLIIKGDRTQVINMLYDIEGIVEIKEDEEETGEGVGLTVYADTDQDIREAIFLAMAKVSCPILEMHQLVTSLEDVFLALTKKEEEKAC
ncbi:MAG: ABC transporter ATP-binding protein [Clostridiaceae bacterium]|nr:ABC transporter ATP-binding protein [Clostridiaceae bacterium]